MQKIHVNPKSVIKIKIWPSYDEGDTYLYIATAKIRSFSVTDDPLYSMMVTIEYMDGKTEKFCTAACTDPDQVLEQLLEADWS